MVTIISGPADASVQLEGSTVGTARAQFSGPLSIPPGARATVNGSAVDDSYVLQTDDELQFNAAAAEKGR